MFARRSADLPALPYALPLFALLVLGGCAPSAPHASAPVADQGAEVIGAAGDCLTLASVTTTRIRDDRTIDFLSAGGSQVWRATLPNRCAGLSMAGAFTYETSLTRLCRGDIIYPILRSGSQLTRGAGCAMGPFVPIRLAD